MGGDRLPVRVHLAEEERLDEAPRGGDEVEVLHRLPELERAHHVALDLDVALQIGVADASLVDAGDRRKPRRFFSVTVKLGAPSPKRCTAPSGRTTSNGTAHCENCPVKRPSSEGLPSAIGADTGPPVCRAST